MSSFAAFFALLASSLPSRVLLALGVGWVSFSGFQVIIDDLVTTVVSDYNSIPSAMYQILSLAGVTDGIGMVLGAFAAKGAIYGVKVLGNISG